MNIRNIMTKAIKKAGGDGLCNPHNGCGHTLRHLQRWTARPHITNSCTFEQYIRKIK